MDAPSSTFADTCTVRAAATRAGVGIRTLHYYEARGLLAPRRSEAGYRRYSAGDIERVRTIKRAQSLGFSLSEIGTLLSGDSALAEDFPSTLREAATEKLAVLDARIRELEGMRTKIRTLLEECGCDEAGQPCAFLEDAAGPASPSQGGGNG